VNDAEQHARAEANAPKSPEEVAAAARDMAARGYSDDVVASVLRIDIAAVRQMLGERAA
jgi:sulfur transfer complex TusBCD TusB component (DsrH family)